MEKKKRISFATFVFMICIPLYLTWVGNAQSAAQGNTVTGLLILNKDKIKLSYAYVDLVNPKEPIIVLSDKMLPADSFSISMLTESYIHQKKVHAVLFSLSPQEKKLSGSLTFIYFPGKKSHFIALGNKAELTITRFDDTVINGKYKTPKPVVEDFDEVTFSLDVAFQVNLGRTQASPAPSKKQTTVRRADSPPAKAYAEYYRSCLEGDIDKILPFLAEKERMALKGNIQENREAILYVLTQRPSEVEINPPAISGNSATFTVQGVMRSGETATGSVLMNLEEGTWKVGKDKWEIAGK